MTSIRSVTVRSTFLLLFALAGCGKARERQEAAGGTASTCGYCHGTPGRTGNLPGTDPALEAAPPSAPAGKPATVVGAHLAHVNPPAAAPLRGPLPCSECHVVPTTLAHASNPTATPVTFGVLARTGNAQPTYDATQLGCSAVYCHGNFTFGAVAGNAGTVLWGGPAATCASCHGMPPTGHPALGGTVTAATCSSCHPDTVNPDGTINVTRGGHVNGKADVTFSCTSCHGTAGRTGIQPGTDPDLAAAPPVAPAGAPAYAVGAHLAHLNPSATGSFRGPIACAECHVVPSTADHAANPPAARVVFGTLATNRGATPTWSAATTGCSATYCHGAFGFGGITGASATPLWTGAGLTCTSCHAMPPTGHDVVPAAATACAACHPASVNADGTINLAGGAHLNGQADVELPAASCTVCHGAPPASPHVQNTTCGNCHPGYTSTTVNASTHRNGTVDVVALTCATCHGSAASNAAPPVDTTGASAVSRVSVGAHQSHVNPTLMATGIACAQCHGAASSTYTTAHADGTVQVSFGALANQGTSTVWSHGAATCAASYCHGGTSALNGGVGTTPVWTTVNGTFSSCTSCHGVPPPAPHSQSPACGSCHVGYSATAVNRATHVNGVVDVAGLSCTSCHGTNGVNAAPPVDTTGQSQTGRVSVGAHQAHVTTTLMGAAIACTECHGAASASYTTSHSDGTVQVSFGALANQGTATVWTRGSATCAASYCHGGTTAVLGGTGTTPVWTTVNGTFKACTSCHGDPPALSAASRHPPSAACGSCHGAGYTSSAVAAATHLNGTVNKPANGCTACHGVLAGIAGASVPNTSATAAPGFNASAVDTAGNSAATFAGVGAHQAHLTGTRWRSTSIACNECHVVPASLDVTHVTGTGSGGARATMTFGTLAKTGLGATAAYAGSATAAGGATAGTCSNVYCHGAFTGSGVSAPLSWTGGATAAACGSCHGNPPPAPHVQNTTCSSCHAGYTNTSVNATAHLNGLVDVATMTCTSCHGDAARTGTDPNITSMPPVGTAGETLTSQPAVGAHVAHLTAGTLARAFACTDCHNPPVSTSHATGTTTFSWSVLAGGSAVSYNFANQACSNVYCHGNFAGGIRTNAPVWTAGAAGATCGSCHGAPPVSPHPQSSACGSCHAGYTASTVNLTNHVNGVVEVNALTCTSCHGTAGVNEAPPLDTTGGSATTLVSVGAHQGHVNTALMNAGIACTECHGAASASYTTSHTDGIVQVSFGATANNGTTTVWTHAAATCAASYCHGGSSALQGGTGTTPVWTTVNGTYKACTSCHGDPPPLSTSSHHPGNTACATCHGTGYSSSAVAKATHVDRTVTLSRSGCTLCHGDLTQTAVARTSIDVAPGANATAADTRGNTAASAPAVGAHAAHLTGTSLRAAPIGCDECHVVPATGDVAHATGAGSGGARATLAFGILARTGGIVNATYAGSNTATTSTAAGTCSNTYCHGNFTNGSVANAPSWTGNVTQAACGTCHGTPPGGTHPGNPDCGSCHGAGYSITAVDKTKHMNGVIDADRSACLGCHAYGMNSATTYQHVMVGNPDPATYPTLAGPVIPDADRNCNLCHMKHEFPNPSANLRNTINSATPTASASDLSLCVSCHEGNTMTKDQTRQKSDGTLQTARVDSAGFTGTGHDYLVQGSFGATSFTVNCVKCHASDAVPTIQSGAFKFTLHTSPDRRLRAPLGRATVTDDDSEGFCYRCHSATTDAIGGTTKSATANDWYGVVTGMPAGSTGIYAQMQKPGSGHRVASYVGKHKPNPAEEHLQYLAANKHVDCADCHDPHRAKRGGQGDTGIVTAVATGCLNDATHLCDTTANWPVDAWKGYWVSTFNATATSGAAIGNRVQITGNTATQLTLGSTIGTAPAAGVGYRIHLGPNAGKVSAAAAAGSSTLTDSTKAWPANVFQGGGWYVHIVAGAGVGQSAQILSNTATVLTINGSWTTALGITAGNVSAYVIAKLPNAMQGTSGVAVSAWGSQAVFAWGETKTFSPAAGSTTPLPDATTQWQVCFKCHSSANTSLATWNASWTDLARDFNPRNQSYHPVVAAAGAATGTTGYGNATVVGAMTNGWRAGDLMTCSDCHGNDDPAAGASHGPHASAVAFILKGPNTRWPAQADGTTRWTVNNSTTGLGTAAGLFCRNCHGALSGVHTARSNHQTLACTQCHLRIPHGGKVARLIRTTNTPAPYVDSGVAASLNAYNGGTATSSCGASCATGTHPLAPNTTTAPVNAW